MTPGGQGRPPSQMGSYQLSRFASSERVAQFCTAGWCRAGSLRSTGNEVCAAVLFYHRGTEGTEEFNSGIANPAASVTICLHGLYTN